MSSMGDVPALLRQVDQSVTTTTLDASALARQRIEQVMLSDLPKPKGFDAVIASSEAMSADVRTLTDTLKRNVESQALFQNQFVSTMTGLREELRSMTAAISSSADEAITRRSATGPGVQTDVAAGLRESFEPGMGATSAASAARGGGQRNAMYDHYRAEELRSAMRASGDYRDAPHRKWGSENIIRSVLSSEEETGGRVSADDAIRMQREAEFQNARERLRGARGAGLSGLRQEVMEGAARRVSEVDPTTGGGRLLRSVTGALASPSPRESLLADVGGMRYGGMALRAAGTGALLLGAADQVGDFAESQRAQNAVYQRALGGSNLEGFAERGRERLFGLSQFGVMGDQQAADLYRGVTQLGLRGDDRQQALSFGSNAYKQFGMDIRDSIAMVEEARRRGVDSFIELTDSLERVTTSARDAGVSAEQARAGFQRSFQSFAPTIGGQAAMVGAEAMTSLTASMGPEFANTTFNNLFNENSLRMMAAQRGQTYGEFQQGLNDPSGVAMAEAVVGREGDVRQQLRERAPEAFRVAQEFMRGREGRTLRPGERDALVGQMMEAGLGELDPAFLQQYLGSEAGLGWQMDQSQVYEAVATVASGGGPGTATIESINDRQRSLGTRSVGIEGRTADHIEVRGDVDMARRQLLSGGNQYNDGIFGIGGDDHRRALANEYATLSMESSERGSLQKSGIMERFIEASDKGSMYEVQTPNGIRVVSAQDAIKFYPEEIQSGRIRAFNGPNEGQTVAEQFQFEEGSLGEGLGLSEERIAEREKQEKADEIGMTVEEAEAQREERARGETGGRITVTPHPDLARLLEFSTQGNVDLQWGRNNGVPPSPYDPGM